MPRRNAVIQVMFSSFSCSSAPVVRLQQPQEPVQQHEVLLDKDTQWHDGGSVERHGSAVWQWWFGPAPAERLVTDRPQGYWRSYHPQVSATLEQALRFNTNFSAARGPVDVDGACYMMQRITPESSFDYCDRPSREKFEVDNIVTVKHPCFSPLDRDVDGCFVQFQKDNPHRRRPARRCQDPAALAAQARKTGRPCNICFSEDGQVVGCRLAHVICQSCLRLALRSMVGDVTVQEKLICGCLSKRDGDALEALGVRADLDLQHTTENRPSERFAAMDFENELQTMGPNIPEDYYCGKVGEWRRRVFINDHAASYHPCSHPACAWKVENWMPVDRFERECRTQGRTQWMCPDGHLNSVLPSEAEINDNNRFLLQAPEYYIERAEYNGCPLRKHRLCEACAEVGVLMLAEHDSGCKQWPAGGRGHVHCFCFACARPWGSGAEGCTCNHQALDCQDPGVQQVRSRVIGGVGTLEVGYVDGREYIRWLDGLRPTPPPTRFKSGFEEPGEMRQHRLGLTRGGLAHASV